MKKYFTILNIILFQSFIWGQTITGSVKDRITNGNLDGVNITIQGTSKGTSTDLEGKFTLDISGISKDQIIKLLPNDLPMQEIGKIHGNKATCFFKKKKIFSHSIFLLKESHKKFLANLTDNNNEI